MNSLYIDYSCGVVFNKQVQVYKTVHNRDLNVSKELSEEELFWELKNALSINFKIIVVNGAGMMMHVKQPGKKKCEDQSLSKENTPFITGIEKSQYGDLMPVNY